MTAATLLWSQHPVRSPESRLSDGAGKWGKGMSLPPLTVTSPPGAFPGL